VKIIGLWQVDHFLSWSFNGALARVHTVHRLTSVLQTMSLRSFATKNEIRLFRYIGDIFLQIYFILYNNLCFGGANLLVVMATNYVFTCMVPASISNIDTKWKSRRGLGNFHSSNWPFRPLFFALWVAGQSNSELDGWDQEKSRLQTILKLLRFPKVKNVTKIKATCTTLQRFIDKCENIYKNLLICKPRNIYS